MISTGATMMLGTWIWIMMLGGSGALTIGGAPLPLDPALSAIAPPECLLYLAYSGQGPADPESPNQSEQLFAEPQMVRFVASVEKQIMAAVKRGAASAGDAEKVAADAVPVLVKALMTRPFALYVEEVVPGEEGVDAQAAFVFHAGDQRQAVAKAIDRLLTLKPEGSPPISKETAAGVEWQRIETPPQAPALRWGWKGDYLIVAVGEKTPAVVLERMKGAAPQWLDVCRREHPIDRELSVAYVNIAAIVERVAPFASQNPEWQVAQRLGLSSLKAFHAVSGYDAVGVATMAHLETDGKRSGLLALLPYKPLSKRDLQAIPKNPFLATAVRLDVGEVWDEVVRIAGDLEPRSEAEIEEGLERAERELGFHLRDDLVEALDDVWAAYLPGGDLMSSWLGAAAIVKVKDRAALEGAVENLVDAVKINAGGEVTIRKTEEEGRVMYTLGFGREAIPIAPSWSVGEEWLAIGLTPQAVVSAMERTEDESLAAVDAIRDALGENPASISYQDTPRLVQSLYPWLQMGAMAMSGQLRKEGIDVDLSAMPSVDIIVKHLRPSVTTMAFREDGYHITSRHSLPGGGNLIGAAPLLVGLTLPAVQAARTAARSNQDVNHMKQIALAFHNYADAHNHFPTNVYDDDGEPLLSWRVQILPYLEGKALYDQIHLDEPWDSEHNRQLALQMPTVFQSANDPAAPGKTRFVALTGKGTVSPGAKEIGFPHVRDGLSNTILYVQAAPDSAVNWMKPEDIEFDADEPFAGLNNASRKFLAAFCDGSVTMISLEISEELMEALVTRAGGEQFDRSELLAPAGR